MASKDSKHILTEFRQFPVHSAIAGQDKHTQSRITIAAGGLIFAHNKVLLDRSDNSDLWSVPGGIVRLDESPETAVKRALQTELNLTVEVLPSEPFIFTFNLSSDPHDHTAGIREQIYLIHFLVKLKEPVRLVLGKEVVDYKWEPVGSNFRDCYPNVKAAVDNFVGLR